MPSKAPAAATDARAPPPPACAARLAPRLGCEPQLLCQTDATHRWAFPPSDYIGPDDHRETDDLARVSAGGNALQLNFVFGYTGRRVRQNLFYNADGRLVYHTAAVGVVYDKERHAQVSDPPPPRRRTRPLVAVPRPRLAPPPPPCPPTRGLRRSDLGVISPQLFFKGHDDDITAMDIHPDRVRVVTGQIGKEPKILVWSSRHDANGNLPQLCCIQGDHKRAIICLSFSSTGARSRRRAAAPPRHNDRTDRRDKLSDVSR